MKRNTLILSLVALVLVICAGMGTTWSYFSTYAETAGGVPIAFNDRTEIIRIEEEFSDWTKHVVLKSDANSNPVFVRVKAFSGLPYDLTYYAPFGNWTLGDDGFYYYNEILNGGGSTNELQIRINNVPANAADKDNFNVVVVYEYTPVLYAADGTAYADWNARVDNGGNK